MIYGAIAYSGTKRELDELLEDWTDDHTGQNDNPFDNENIKPYSTIFDR